MVLVLIACCTASRTPLRASSSTGPGLTRHGVRAGLSPRLRLARRRRVIPRVGGALPCVDPLAADGEADAGASQPAMWRQHAGRQRARPQPAVERRVVEQVELGRRHARRSSGRACSSAWLASTASVIGSSTCRMLCSSAIRYAGGSYSSVPVAVYRGVVACSARPRPAE